MIRDIGDGDEEEDSNAIDGHLEDFVGDNSNTGPDLGHDATGQSPMAHSQPNILIVSPPKQTPALRPSSFPPVVNNPLPSMEGAVKVDPNSLKELPTMVPALDPTLSQCQ